MNLYFKKKLNPKMDALIENTKVLLEEERKINEISQLEIQRAEWRSQKNKLIAQYEVNIKNMILKIYEEYSKEIARMIEICKLIKEKSTSLQELANLTNELEKYRRSICNTYKLQVYRESYCEKFPSQTWDIQVRQEWLDHWGSPVIMKNSTTWEKWKEINYSSSSLPNSIKGILELDCDYKGNDIWIDVGKSILNCHLWRQRYGLNHLDAVSKYC